LAVCLASATVQVEAATTDEEVRYGRDIRTLLSDRCFECHGSDSAARESGLRLDQRAQATADLGGYAAIVPGDVDASELWLRINSTDPEEQMPPPSAKKRPFTQEDRARIARWIETGATYEEHWAFVAPVRPELPGLSREDWPRGGIDAFILARLEALGIGLPSCAGCTSISPACRPR
jgi:mono/diheme cytochrome c family protein